MKIGNAFTTILYFQTFAFIFYLKSKCLIFIHKTQYIKYNLEFNLIEVLKLLNTYSDRNFILYKFKFINL